MKLVIIILIITKFEFVYNALFNLLIKIEWRKFKEDLPPDLFNNLIQLKNHRFEVGLFPFKKINNNEYLPKHNFYIKITEKYDVCNFDENELSTDGGKALSLQNNIYLIKVWWNKMVGII